MEERLQKFLARAGIASRRKAEALIEEGRVAVNGKVVRKMGVKVDPERDEVRVDTVRVRPAPVAVPRVPRAEAPAPPRGMPHDPAAAIPSPLPEGIYLLLNKPRGFLTTTSDDRGRRTVMDLLPRLKGRAWPVGRLDEDSEGLLLITNDGALTNLLTHPRYEVPKVYDLRVRGEVGPEDVLQVERGVWLSEGRTGPARLLIRRHGRDISHVQLVLREGKNREVRRIFARLRHPVLSLRRVSLGPLALAGLKPGQVRRLDRREIRGLYAAALRGMAESGPAPSGREARPRRPSKEKGRPPRRDPKGGPSRRDSQGRPPRRDAKGGPPRREWRGARR
jgi:23S rRNA pseudouridine2605 synthase